VGFLATFAATAVVLLAVGAGDLWTGTAASVGVGRREEASLEDRLVKREALPKYCLGKSDDDTSPHSFRRGLFKKVDFIFSGMVLHYHLILILSIISLVIKALKSNSLRLILER